MLSTSGSIAEVSARFRVSKSYLLGRVHDGVGLGMTTGAQGNHVPLKLGKHEAMLAARVQAINDQALEQLC